MTKAEKLADENADLKRRVEALEAKSTPAPYDARETERRIAEHRDQMHQLAERRMSHASNFHPDDFRAMEAAAPTYIVKGIALRDARAPTGPNFQGGIPSSQQVSNVRGGGVPGGGTGWSREIPLSNPPGTHLVDALCIADDVKQRLGKK